MSQSKRHEKEGELIVKSKRLRYDADMNDVILSQLKVDILRAVDEAKTLEELERVRVEVMGRKSRLTALLKSLGSMDSQEKRQWGPALQALKKDISEALEAQKTHIERDAFDWAGESIDVTLPGTSIEQGHLHPTTRTLRDIEDIFTAMGFDVADGPEIETEFYNFDALNIPGNHPARDAWDTFWLHEKNEKGDRLALRPHTSPVQIHYMQSHTPPFRVIVPGKCFRNESTDASHEHTFHQFEALMVGDDVNVANFKYVGEEFFSRFFGQKVTVRLRPSFFPFTEPSFEFDISCTVCGGKKCSSCKQTGWLEVGGAGMVNQNVFVASGYERNRYQGFAWGFGVERLAMMKYKIDDIRLFHSGDLRFVRQF